MKTKPVTTKPWLCSLHEDSGAFDTLSIHAESPALAAEDYARRWHADHGSDDDSITVIVENARRTRRLTFSVDFEVEVSVFTHCEKIEHLDTPAGAPAPTTEEKA